MILLRILGCLLIGVGSLMIYLHTKRENEYKGSEEHFIDVQHGIEEDNNMGFTWGFTIFIIGLVILNGCSLAS